MRLLDEKGYLRRVYTQVSLIFFDFLWFLRSRIEDDDLILSQVTSTDLFQNIDSLEFVAGMNKERVIHAHGSHQTSTCLKCKKKFDLDWITGFLRQTTEKVPRCSCGGLIKPDIVFFGESLPSKFFTSAINVSRFDLVRC